MTGWKSDIPYVSKEYRKTGERESSLTIDLSGVQAFSPTRGTLEMWVQFDGSIVDEQADTLFSFTDNTQTDLFTVYLNWFSRFDPAKTSLLFTGKAYTPDGAPVYGRYALFDRGIRKGQWVHVALTWGPGGEAENLVYQNGKRAGSYYVGSVEEGVAGVAQAVKRGGNLSSYISGARYLLIGSDARSNWVFRHGLIGDVALHDEVLTKLLRTVKTYAEGAANSDPYYNENLVLSDLPAGLYKVAFTYQDKPLQYWVDIYPGQITYFTFDGEDGFEVAPPPVPTLDFLAVTETAVP